jgi:hypothetical protein
MSRLTDIRDGNNESGSGGARRGYDCGLGRALPEPGLFGGRFSLDEFDQE